MRDASEYAQAFDRLRAEYLADFYRREPTMATYLGRHEHDDRLEDYSAEAVTDEIEMARGYQARLAAIPADALPFEQQVERQQLILNTEATLLEAEVIRPWATSPDRYSSGLTNSAYSMVKREFAPAEVRLRDLVSRLRAMPEALAAARRNLDNPPRVYTELAIEQLDGNRAFFEHAVPEAFAEVSHPGLQREFQDANAAVISALSAYQTWLEADLLPRSRGKFVCGADTYRKRLWAEEMVDTPLEDLLSMAEADLACNREAFIDTARRMGPARPTAEVLADVERRRPRVADLMAATQGEMDALAGFLADRRLVTVPDGAPVRVKETPPFLRATTSASIEVPGPFEQVATEAYYNLTLPDPSWSRSATDDFMRQWYYAAITNVSAHEVWPGHHLQFLHARSLTSDVRKVFSTASNVEGWAHYAEQLVIEEGFHGDEPEYRLAQLQDALLRDARFVVGIRMHTQDMTVEQAESFFLREAYQTPHVARIEARRGTFDATYGYYTLGKLMVLDLREAYRRAVGPGFSLRGFHDAFMKAGPLPLRLAADVMWRDAGLADPSLSHVQAFRS